MPRGVVCPYCGSVSNDLSRCAGCGGRFDALSRQLTQNSMGPWSVRGKRPSSRPGCSYEVIASMARDGRIGPESVVRGPSTRQFWTLAKRTPGVANLFGLCHNCQAEVGEDAYGCGSCGAVFDTDRDRQHLGLGPVRLLPGEASAERVAAHTAAVNPPTPVPGRDAPPPEVSGDDADPTPSVPAVSSTERRLRRDLERQRRLNLLLVVVVVVLGAGGVWAVTQGVDLQAIVPADSPASSDATPAANPDRAEPVESSEPATEASVVQQDARSPDLGDRALLLVEDGTVGSLRLAEELLRGAASRTAREDEMLERIRAELESASLRELP